MRVLRRYLVAAALTIVLAHASPARAATWSMPVGGGVPILGFGAQYAGGTHRGVDVTAAAGADVISPAGGTVAFAGQVPADGGGTCGAVTIQLADGHRVSLLPLESLCVSTGDGVDAGDALGSLAVSGDDSSAAAHLHVGLRSGELYLDPAAFLPAGGGVGPEPAPETEPAVVPDAPAATSVGSAPAAPIPGVVAATPASEPAAPVSTSAVVQAEVGEAAPVVDTAMPVTASRAVTHAEPPATAAPNTAPHTVRAGIRMPWFSPRPVTSALLALGMLATGIAIVRVRRASPVHER